MGAIPRQTRFPPFHCLQGLVPWVLNGVSNSLRGCVPMSQRHVPLLNARFWIALCIASVFGANLGDFFAHDIGLGHVAGLPFLAAAFALVLIVERYDTAAHALYYWLARSEEHTSELQSLRHLVCRLLL